MDPGIPERNRCESRGRVKEQDETLHVSTSRALPFFAGSNSVTPQSGTPQRAVEAVLKRDRDNEDRRVARMFVMTQQRGDGRR